MMNKITVRLLLFINFTVMIMIGTLLLGFGTGEQDRSYAIVDLDKVADSIGESEKIVSRVNDFVKQQQQLLEQERQKNQAEIEHIKKNMGDELSSQQQAQYQQRILQINNQLRRKNQQIVAQTEQLKRRLVQAFRKQITPVITRAARSNGYQRVEIVSPNYIYVSPDIDISEQVIHAVEQKHAEDKGIENRLHAPPWKKEA